MAEKNQQKLQDFRLIAFKNKHNRYFVAGKENYFGKTKQDYVMLDNGCNTLLLTLPISNDETTKEFYASYPFNKYKWELNESRGTSMVRALTVKILPFAIDEKFPIILSLLQFQFQSDFLRFSISYDDVNLLIKNIPGSSLNKFVEQLIEYKNFIEDIQKICEAKYQKQIPNFQAKRSHALLGQSVLQKLILIQTKFGCYGVSDKFQINDITALDNQFSEFSIDFITKFPEFNDLKDDDHDCSDEILFQEKDEIFY